MDGCATPKTPIYARSPGCSALMPPPTPVFARIMSSPSKRPEQNAYAILGVDPEAPLSEIRIAYHRLVRETHPDLVVAKGLPPECVALATARIARINAAYDSVAKRGSIRAAAYG